MLQADGSWIGAAARPPTDPFADLAQTKGPADGPLLMPKQWVHSDRWVLIPETGDGRTRGIWSDSATLVGLGARKRSGFGFSSQGQRAPLIMR